jgi:hypothetical protein
MQSICLSKFGKHAKPSFLWGNQNLKIKMKNFLSIVCLSLALAANSQSTFQNIYDGGGVWERGLNVIPAHNNNGFIVVGSVDPDGDGNMVGMVLHQNSNGSTAWAYYYPCGSVSEFTAVTYSVDGYVFTGAARNPDSGDLDAVFGQIDSAGVLSGVDIALIEISGTDELGTDIHLMTSGDYVICGGNSDRQAFVIRVDASGSVVWEQEFGGTGMSNLTGAYSIGENESGCIILTGHTTDYQTPESLSGLGQSNLFIAEFSSSGVMMGLVSFSIDSTILVGYDLICEGGYYYVCGFAKLDTSAANKSSRSFVACVDTNFVVVWMNEFYNDNCSSIHYCNLWSIDFVDRSIVVAGTMVTSNSTGEDAMLIELDASTGSIIGAGFYGAGAIQNFFGVYETGGTICAAGVDFYGLGSGTPGDVYTVQVMSGALQMGCFSPEQNVNIEAQEYFYARYTPDTYGGSFYIASIGDQHTFGGRTICESEEQMMSGAVLVDPIIYTEVYDTFGRLVSIGMDYQSLPAGVYIVRKTTASGRMYTEKIMANTWPQNLH